MPEPTVCPCPTADPCAYENFRSSARDSKFISPDQQEHPCPCRTCCCGQPIVVKPCYKQPRIPESYAPRRCYIKPSAPVEGGTTYKLSYLPTEGCRNLRIEPKRPPQNIKTSSEPMEGNTVQRLSFLPNPICVTQPLRPCNHDMWGRGPMQNLTTQRHDFVPKPCVLRNSFKPPHKIHNVDHPFEDRTVNKMSYLPPQNVEVPKSFAPERCYEKPTAKMDIYTTHKSSYLPNPIMPRQPTPWSHKEQYQKPNTKIDGSTIYNQSYLDAKSDCRRQAIIPDACSNPVTSSKNFESQTVYKNSYLPAKAPPNTSFKPLHSLVTSTAPMDGDTVHKLSYLPVPVCMTESIRPCNHDMWGRGPMQLLTTQKHDYVLKPCVIRKSFKPHIKYEGSDHPFEDRTVNRLSYLDPGKQGKQNSFAPVNCYVKPASKMECQTTQKMSYRPVCAIPPEQPSWARREQYFKPSTKLDGTTVYRSSFLPPGEDCTEYIDPCEYGDCKPCKCVCPSECISKDPCACAFPKAEAR